MDDLLFLDEQLSDDERLVRDTVRKFVDEAISPLILPAFEQGIFPKNLIKEIANLGFLGFTLPEVYGGAGAGPVAYGLLCQELERGDSAIRSFVSVQSSLCMYPIFKYGTEAQKQQYLPSMAKGDCIGCFGLTEANSGSDPASMHTRAKKVSNGYRISGSKLWITNAMLADIAIIWAATDDGFAGFIVETDTPGFSRQEIHHKMSLRASNTGELILDDVFVSEKQRLDCHGLGAALSCLNQARYGIAWGVMGAAMSCFEIAQDYVKNRKQFNKPLGAFQLIQNQLVEMYNEIIKAQCMHLRIGRLKEASRETPVMISLMKRNACDEALKIARQCRNILGANGISLEFQVIRHMLNLESVFTYEGTHNVHTLVIGKHLTGLSAFE